MTGIDAGAARSLLEWWQEAGVDVVTSDAATCWLDLQTKAGPSVEQVGVSDPEPPSAAPAETIEAMHQRLAARSVALGGFHVAPVGDLHPRLMIIGDRPDQIDSAAGRPFAGEPGQMLERMLAALNIDSDYRALLEPCHRAGTRIEQGDLAELADLARQQIGLVQPKLLLLFGDAPAQALLGQPLPQARGQVHEIAGIRTVVTFHPRWLLKRPGDKSLAWADLLLLTAPE